MATRLAIGENNYSEAKYTPQHIDAVHVWQAWRDGHPADSDFIMTLGNEWGCASAWHDVYYRVWRLDSTGAKLLIDGSDFAWLRTQTYIVGSIGRSPIGDNAPVDVLVEFTTSSIDGAVRNREAVRHFQIDGDKVQRVDPVALSPRDFVDEWLTHPWEESAAWPSSADFSRFHSKDGVDGEFGITMHCQTPDVWQVELAPLYFLVLWTPPYHFEMIGASASPSPQCAAKDPEADAWRTLFNTQERRH